jgi:hypothetical protein
MPEALFQFSLRDVGYWVKANASKWTKIPQKFRCYGLNVAASTGGYGVVLVAIRDSGVDVFEAATVTFVTIKVARARMVLVEGSRPVTRMRNGFDDDAWREELAKACAELKVDAALLTGMGTLSRNPKKGVPPDANGSAKESAPVAHDSAPAAPPPPPAKRAAAYPGMPRRGGWTSFTGFGKGKR